MFVSDYNKQVDSHTASRYS